MYLYLYIYIFFSYVCVHASRMIIQCVVITCCIINGCSIIVSWTPTKMQKQKRLKVKGRNMQMGCESPNGIRKVFVFICTYRCHAGSNHLMPVDAWVHNGPNLMDPHAANRLSDTPMGNNIS